jgi:hypothetical protein
LAGLGFNSPASNRFVSATIASFIGVGTPIARPRRTTYPFK